MWGKGILALAVLAGVLGTAAAPAGAQVPEGPRVCEDYWVKDQRVYSVCFEVETGLAGTTVAPSLLAWACWSNRCPPQTAPIRIDTTGVETAETYDLTVDGSGVRWGGGDLGHAWIDGVRHTVSLPPFCTGTPEFCD